MKTLTLLLITSLAMLTGQLALAADVTLSTPVSGVIIKIPVRSGQKVEKGQVLVQLDDSVFTARNSAAEAQLALHTRQLKEQERNIGRAQEMYDNGNLSDHELELARIELDRARADYHEAAASAAEARFNLHYSAVRAPYDGVVKAILVNTGQTVINSDKVTPMVKFSRK